MNDKLRMKTRRPALDWNDEEVGASCQQEDISNINSFLEDKMDSYARERISWRAGQTQSQPVLQTQRTFETRGINTQSGPSQQVKDLH